MKEKNVNYLEKDHLGSTHKALSMQKMIISYFCQPSNSQFIIHNPPLVYVHHLSLSICEASDPADEFHSPYVYCANNPIMLVDPDGKKTELYVHSGGSPTGHVALNVNGTVYSYGRYNPDALSSCGLKGDGILREYPEKEYLTQYNKRDDIEVFSLKYSPEQEQQIVNNFNNLKANKPASSKGVKVDNYKVTLNNCTTTVINALPNGFVKNFFKSIGIFRPQETSAALKIMDIMQNDVKQLPTIQKGTLDEDTKP